MKNICKITFITALSIMIAYNLFGGVSLRGTGWLVFDLSLLTYLILRD